MLMAILNGGGDNETWNHKVRIDSSSTWTVPSNCHSLTLWLVGGGGGGSGSFYGSGQCGNGGNGGQVLKQTISVGQGDTLDIAIGQGGKGGAYNSAGSAGGNTSVACRTGTYTALGGAGGGMDSNVPVSSFGGATGGRATWWSQILPGDGTEIEYEGNKDKYGAGGGGGCHSMETHTRQPGGETGGGLGGGGDDNTPDNDGDDATFYGSGGGGAAFSSNHTYASGGAGFKGCVIICYN